jgi:hypothetical protein
LVVTLGGSTSDETFANVWDGTSDSRPDATVVRAPDPDDWRALVTQINNLEKRVQPLGIPDAGRLPVTEPATGGYLWQDGTAEVQSLAAIASVSGTFNLAITLPGNSAVNTIVPYDSTAAALQILVDAAFANEVVNGVAYAAGDIAVGGGPMNSSPVTLTFSGACVANTNIAICVATDIDLSDSTPPVESETTPGVPGVVTVSDEAGSHTNSLWDGTSPSRANGEVYRAPDWQDYEEARRKLYDMSQKLVPLGFSAIGAAPTSDPTVRDEVWTNTLICTVSNG